MAWIVSKIVGDGRTLETAFRCAINGIVDLFIIDGEVIPTNEQTGLPLAPFAISRIPDADIGLAVDAGCYVVPSGQFDASVEIAGLAAQGCVISEQDMPRSPELLLDRLLRLAGKARQ